jgi:N-hydroxyarylamine O-acetyltransferase
MRVDDYLERIGHGGSTAPTARTLAALHRAHIMAVPFENLDIHLGIPIALSLPAFFEKIVGRRRGGFCYELNGLFAWLLAELGFRVAIHSARVASDRGLSPEFDHLCLSVALESLWIADVGFGDSSIVPVRARDGGPGDEYSTVEDGGVLTLRRPVREHLVPQYAFTLLPRRLDEFAERCLWQQTSPESHFTRGTVCSRATPQGRITLSGRRLIVTTGDRREERELAGAEEMRDVLSRQFGVGLPERDVERLFPI